MKIVAVVPIKLLNRRCPNKNIRRFENGKPLCTYILNTLLKIAAIDEVYVYCSDSNIKEYLPTGVKFIKRPTELDLDTAKMNEVLYCFQQEVDADIYVMTHVTAPFVKTESIEAGIVALTRGEYDSAFAVKRVQDFMWKDGRPFNYSLSNIPRTQDLEPLFMETSGFYIYTKEMMEREKRRIGTNPYLVEVDEIESIDIDEEIDFSIAEAIYNYILREKNDGKYKNS